MERPYITLRSSIVDAFTDDQLYELMGHELTHIKCGHVLYSTVGRVLITILESLGRYTFGVGDVLSMALVVAFYEWSRQAEITCDRGGLARLPRLRCRRVGAHAIDGRLDPV